MLVWIDGAFGVGKTTVAKALARRWPAALTFDPEQLGFMLRRIVPPDLRTRDFQDMQLWRQLVRQTAAGLIEHYERPLIVPMALPAPATRSSASCGAPASTSATSSCWPRSRPCGGACCGAGRFLPHAAGPVRRSAASLRQQAFRSWRPACRPASAAFATSLSRSSPPCRPPSPPPRRAFGKRSCPSPPAASLLPVTTVDE